MSMIDKLIFNELASHRAVALPRVGVLRVVRRSAHMENGGMVPPRNLVVYSAVFDGQTNLPTEGYDEWLAGASVSGDLVIEGVGRLTMGEFVASDELERVLNGDSHVIQSRPTGGVEPASAASPLPRSGQPTCHSERSEESSADCASSASETRRTPPPNAAGDIHHTHGLSASPSAGGVRHTPQPQWQPEPPQWEPANYAHKDMYTKSSRVGVQGEFEGGGSPPHPNLAAAPAAAQPGSPQWEPANYTPRDEWRPAEPTYRTPPRSATPIYAPPVPRPVQRTPPSTPHPPHSTNNTLLIVAIVLMLALLAAIVCYVMPLRRDLAAARMENQTLQTQVQQQAAQIAQLKTPAAVVEAVPDVPNVEKYHLIVGSFTDPARAEQRADYYRQHFTNLTIKVFDNGAGRTYVSVFQTDSKRTAYTRFLKIAEQTGNWDDMWVWERP